MRNKGQLLQDPFLNTLRLERIPVSMFLVNGIKLQGQIESFDQYSVVLKGAAAQMVFKHAISTIVPSRPINMAKETAGAARESDGQMLPLSVHAEADASDKKPQVTIKRTRARSVTV